MAKKIASTETIIHIKAESKFISSTELVPENKAVKRLEDIRESFLYMKRRFDKKGDAVLKVKTCVHNPKLFA